MSAESWMVSPTCSLHKDLSSYCRCVVEVKVTFFDALTMITFRIRKPKQPLLQVPILLVPEAESNIQKPVRIGYAGNAILSPAECSGS